MYRSIEEGQCTNVGRGMENGDLLLIRYPFMGVGDVIWGQGLNGTQTRDHDFYREDEFFLKQAPCKGRLKKKNDVGIWQFFLLTPAKAWVSASFWRWTSLIAVTNHDGAIFIAQSSSRSQKARRYRQPWNWLTIWVSTSSSAYETVVRLATDMRVDASRDE